MMEQKITRTIHRTSKLDPSQSGLYRALSELAGVVARVLEKELEPKIYCKRCRAEVPDRQTYCPSCEKLVSMEARVQARILPNVKTIGGFAGLFQKWKVAEVYDNPRCYCPDCGSDLGDFYSNRIKMVRDVARQG